MGDEQERPAWYSAVHVQEVDRLANGNTLIDNWAGSLPMEEWPKAVQLIEVTPGKKVVWALRDWTTLGRPLPPNCWTNRASRRMAICNGSSRGLNQGFRKLSLSFRIFGSIIKKV